MTDIHLVHSLTKTIKLAIDTIPTEVTGLTVVAVHGNQVQLSADPGGAQGVWSYGILEPLSGDAEGIKTVIVNSQDDVMTLGSTFSREYPLAVGDSVKLSGGPLKNSRVYMFEPISVKKALDSGVKFLITVNSLDGVIKFRGMGGNDTKGMSAAMREYGMEVVLETPDITGEFNDTDDVKRVLFELPLLKDQVSIIAHYFKLQEGSRAYGIGPIEFTYARIQRTGSQVERKACIMEFDISTI